MGIKGSRIIKDSALFFKMFSYKANFFKTLIENEIIPYEVFGDVFYRNATKTNRYGLKLESRLEIFKDLTFAFLYTYSYSIYDSYAAISIETDTTGNIIQVNRDFSGNKEPNVPENNLTLSLSYIHAVGKKINLTGKVSYQNISGFWVDDANTDKTNSCDLLNVNIGFDMKFGHIKLSGSGGINNIFDKVYAGYTTSNSANKRFYNPGSPRNYFCSVNIGYLF
jgi:iron complex outermembrane receptor protein